MKKFLIALSLTLMCVFSASASYYNPSGSYDYDIGYNIGFNHGMSGRGGSTNYDRSYDYQKGYSDGFYDGQDVYAQRVNQMEELYNNPYGYY